MPFWGWFLTWIALGIGALVYLGLLGYRLLNKATAAIEAADPMLLKLKALADAANQPAEYEPNPDNLFDDPKPLINKQLAIAKQRKAKAAERQRRLVNKLIDFDFDESEFKNEP